MSYQQFHAGKVKLSGLEKKDGSKSKQEQQEKKVRKLKSKLNRDMKAAETAKWTDRRGDTVYVLCDVQSFWGGRICRSSNK